MPLTPEKGQREKRLEFRLAKEEEEHRKTKNKLRDLTKKCMRFGTDIGYKVYLQGEIAKLERQYGERQTTVESLLKRLQRAAKYERFYDRHEKKMRAVDKFLDRHKLR